MKKIAELIYPNVLSIDYYIKKYPKRNLNNDALVTRFAPSPTGFLHIGSLYVALLCKRLALQSDGIFYIRIEDTDKEREVFNGVHDLLRALKRFNITSNEDDYSENNYGPYVQSQRKDIYLSFVKHLIENDYAYPCFCDSEELTNLRETQTNIHNVRTGYYGKWATCRSLSEEDVINKLKNKTPYVIRLKSYGDIEKSFKFKDSIKGDLTIVENDLDIVLIKSDGLPTYHFAHLVDDYLMGTTMVIRGDEWISTLPVHLQLFKYFNFTPPKYGHIAPIMKIDGDDGGKRKISKRKDPEANVDFYRTSGYPAESVVEYLLNIANSDFEDWRKQFPMTSDHFFTIKLNKLSKSGALFDFAKLNDVSKGVISRMPVDEKMADRFLFWLKEFDPDFANIITSINDYYNYILKILSLNSTRRELATWADFKKSYAYFYDDIFKQEKYVFSNYSNNISLLKNIAFRCINLLKEDFASQQEWFEKVKTLAKQFNFSSSVKEFKTEPEKYVGSITDFMTILRELIIKRTNSPELYDIINIIGKKDVTQRLYNFLSY